MPPPVSKQRPELPSRVQGNAGRPSPSRVSASLPSLWQMEAWLWCRDSTGINNPGTPSTFVQYTTQTAVHGDSAARTSRAGWVTKGIQTGSLLGFASGWTLVYFILSVPSTQGVRLISSKW